MTSDSNTNQWSPATTMYFGTDGHGSVRVLYDAVAAILTSAANLAQVFHFDTYGNLLNLGAGSTLTSYLYSGEAFDFNIGQQYLRAWLVKSCPQFKTVSLEYLR